MELLKEKLGLLYSLGDQHVDRECFAFSGQRAKHWSCLSLRLMVCLCTFSSDYSPYTNSGWTPDSALNNLKALCPPPPVSRSERSRPAWVLNVRHGSAMQTALLKFNVAVQTCCFSSLGCLSHCVATVATEQHTEDTRCSLFIWRAVEQDRCLLACDFKLGRPSWKEIKFANHLKQFDFASSFDSCFSQIVYCKFLNFRNM